MIVVSAVVRRRRRRRRQAAVVMATELGSARLQARGGARIYSIGS